MTTSRESFRFFHRLRVRWAEVDMQKIVFNGHYLMYLDTAMGDYWRALAVPYTRAMALLEGDIFVKKATLEYHASARYDDALDIGLRCARVGKSSMVFEGAIYRRNELLVSGELVYVFADPIEQRSRPVPETLRALYDSFEGGAAMTHLECGTWAEFGEPITQLRQAAALLEPGLLQSEFKQAAEATGTWHAVIQNGLGQVIATGYLVTLPGNTANIDGLVTEPVLRSQGLGAHIVSALSVAAHERGYRQVSVSAPGHLRGYFEKLGFTVAHTKLVGDETHILVMSKDSQS